MRRTDFTSQTCTEADLRPCSARRRDPGGRAGDGPVITVSKLVGRAPAVLNTVIGTSPILDGRNEADDPVLSAPDGVKLAYAVSGDGPRS